MTEVVSASNEAGTDGLKALDAIRSVEMTDVATRVRRAGFNLLLETGEPVPIDRIAEATGLDGATVRSALDGAPGRTETDGKGRLLGIAGLTITPTRHRITLGERKRWTWCALDAIGILGAMAATGAIQTTDPQTGQPLSIAFAAGVPRVDAAIFILDGFDPATTRQTWCPNVNIFATGESAREWAKTRDVGGEITTIAEILEQAATLWRPVADSCC